MKHRLLSFILILAMTFGPIPSSLLAGQVSAATGTCYVDDTAAGLNNGSSWKNAYTNLQSALSNLNCTTILVSEGIYYTTKGLAREATFKLRNSLRIFGGFPNGGGLANPATHITILSGDIGVRGDAADNSYHVVTADRNDLSAILDGFTIQDGNANNTNEPMPAIRTDRGGGVYVENGSPTLRTLVIRANSAFAGGCGMYLNSSSPVITDVKFIDNNQSNDATPGSGGGLWSEGNSSPALTRVQFTNNMAAIAGGGFFSTGNPTLTDVGFYNNQAGYVGGGMYNVGNASLTRVIFQENSNFSDGGGLYVDSGSITIRNSQFISNFSRVGGGLSVMGSVTMIDSLIDQNFAGRGAGGMFIGQDSSGTYINLIVTRNQTYLSEYGGGAGIINFSTSSRFTNLLVSGNSGLDCSGMINNNGETEIVNATFVGNHSGEAHSVICAQDGSTQLINTIVWGNTGDVSGADIVVNSQLQITASMLEQGCPAGATCTGLVPGSPQFSDPTNSDFHLKANSPAVGAGSSAALPADTFDLDSDGNVTETIPFDLDGSPRIVGSGVDLGPYEALAPAPAVIYLPYICR